MRGAPSRPPSMLAGNCAAPRRGLRQQPVSQKHSQFCKGVGKQVRGGEQGRGEHTGGAGAGQHAVSEKGGGLGGGAGQPTPRAGGSARGA
jgi:hypothetical protein